MPARARRVVPALLGLVLLASACEMNVRVHARFDSGGAGNLTLGMRLDRELVEAMEVPSADQRSTGLQAIEGLFARLETAGWETTRREGDDGVAFEAMRRFDGVAGFEGALSELGSAKEPEKSVPLAPFTLGYSRKSSFLRTTGRFEGEIDTGFVGDLEPDVRALVNSFREELAQVLHFEIAVEMPGSITITSGEGTVGDGTAVWRPVFGTKVGFAATSSALRAGPVLLVALPVVLGLLALLLLMTRRRTRVSIIVEPLPLQEPAEEPAETDQVIVLDEPVELGSFGTDP